MADNGDEDSDFGTGFDWEDGSYPTPPKDLKEELTTETEPKSTEKSTSGEVPDSDPELENSDLDIFEGTLLSVVPPHTIYAPNSNVETQIGTLYLGNGQDWVRASFWGEAAERVVHFCDVDSSTTLVVSGLMADEEKEVKDLFVFESNDKTGVKRINETIRYTPDPIRSESIEIDSIVEMIVADVSQSIQRDQWDRDGEKFEAQHLALDIDGRKFVAELFDSHLEAPMNQGDTVLFFAGWGKDKDQFIHPDLDEHEYEGKFCIRNYSGLRNITQNPLAE
jgi:hypothetical protein